MSTNPYSPPAATALGSPKSSAGNNRDYAFKPIRGFSWALAICVGLTTAMILLITLITFIGESMWPGFNDPNVEIPDDPTAQMFFLVIGGMAVVSFLIWIAIAIIGPMFSYRSNANARALGASELEYTPGWNAGFWFIPIANLVRPYQATKEVFAATEHLGRGIVEPINPHLLVWWLAYILGGIISQVEFRMATNGIYFPGVSPIISLISTGLLVLAGVLYIRTVLWLGNAQDNIANRGANSQYRGFS